ncbi:MAG TPA: PAS domain S-box protein, partial [Holophagaceae bacterium]
MAERAVSQGGRLDQLQSDPALAEGIPGILDAISEAVYVLDSEGHFLYVNEGAARMYGAPRETLIGQTPAHFSAPGGNDLAAVDRQLAEAFAGTPQQFRFWGRRTSGEAFPKEVRLYPGTYQGQKVVVAMAHDISERLRAERIREATFRIAESALTATDLPQLFAAVHETIQTLLPADNCYLALHDAHAGRVSFPYWVDQKEPHQPERPFGQGLTEFVLRTGLPQLVDSARLKDLLIQGDVAGTGPESLAWLGVPLSGADGTFGVLAVQSYEGGYSYTPEDRDLLSFVSGQVAMAIERKRMETDRRLTRAAVDLSADAVFGMVESGRFIFVNQAACQGLGYTREELLSLGVLDVDPTLTPAAWAEEWAKVRRGEHLRHTTHQRRKDGSLRPVEISRIHFTFEGEEVLFSNVRDITERRQAEEALRLSEAKFSMAFHASPDAINITRVSDGTYLDVSEGFTQMTGWSREECVGHSSLERGIWADPEDRAHIVALLLEHGEFVGYEAVFRAKDGHLIHGLMSGKRLEVNGVPCLLTFTRDITDRKRAEAALKASEQRLWTVLKHVQAVIYQLDSEGRFLLSEGLGLAALGLCPGQVVGLSAFELYRDDPAVQDQLGRALQGIGSRELTRAAGRIYDNTLTPVLDDKGRLESVIGIALDVTPQQEAQEALLAERGLFVGGPVMVIRWRSSPGWPVDYISPNVMAVLGYSAEELVSGRIRFQGLVHPEDFPRIHEDARRNREQGITHY